MNQQLIESLESRTLLSVDYDYLSDLRAIAATTGNGPIERDMSNGERARGDGQAITLNGRHYKKGLGLHAVSEMHFKLAGAYRSFISDVGIDDEAGDAGSVIFQVFADGEKLFDSGVMYGSSATKRVNVDVSSSNELVLVVKDAADGNGFDHADWAGARLIRPTGGVPVVSEIADAQLDEARGFFSASSTFTDARAGPWIGTVDWGDRSSRELLEIDADHAFNISHWFPTSKDANYTVTVRVNNGHAIGIERFNVHVDNLPPSGVGLVGQTDNDGAFHGFAGVTFAAGGSFTDPGAFGGQRYTATVDYGDGTSAVASRVSGRFFDVHHIYSKPGTFTVTSTVTDDGGEKGVGINTVVISTPKYTYLSDLVPTSGAGTFRADHSFAGATLSVNGIKYQKGIGVAGDSEIAFNLNGNFQSLISDVGVDDELDVPGSLTFQLYGNDNLLFNSGPMTIGTRKRMNVDVRGISEIRLVVMNAGLPVLHGDWGGIRLLSPMS